MNFLRISHEYFRKKESPPSPVWVPSFCKIIYANIYHSTYSIRPNMAIVARELSSFCPSEAKGRPSENAALRWAFRRATTKDYFVPESFRDR